MNNISMAINRYYFNEFYANNYYIMTVLFKLN